ncbi:uncharacterized protein LOC126845594 [Adelges cooleyi]|uniref:uncharacterized protein LOC126845594 n=1 Tax=Adelges cooleyi TaxID=133065 RepID=UPI0021806F64|nr:uncharacterized protein LOC126845594 [Adelges cooleyi]XP_050440287.1 uncharacterized protein LOC126845594 [Adelges cooleyi]XP_050440288.1 uncharacterized protein LOC126845594 [Adelges cooleyi]XP_050440290.1 uncharacterized protein LOC126845594 [Adelges cooleyi]XP_050440291.1 uncharacterized protein LOC126845594 [Adelges cooleyi]
MAGNFFKGLSSYIGFYDNTILEHEVREYMSQTISNKYNARVPALWKRMAAQLIDFVFMCILKHLPILCINRDYRLEDWLSIVGSFTFYDYLIWVEDMANHVFYMEVIMAVLVATMAFWCPGRISQLQGITLGKMVFNMRVEMIDNIHPKDRIKLTESGIMEINHTTDLTLVRAIVRSYFKIILKLHLSFYIPKLSLINRSVYDILFRTVVVQYIY